MQVKLHTLNRMFASKRDTVRYLAECYEILVDAEEMELQKTQIARYLYKRLDTLNAEITKVWVYDSLPSKYKSHTENPKELSEFTKNSSLYTEVSDFFSSTNITG